MKTLLLAILATVSGPIHAQVMENQPRTAKEAEQLRRYVLGDTVGECLVGKCAIFTGYLLTSVPQPGEPVAIQVSERLFVSGDPIPDTIRLSYEDPAEAVKPSQAARAWEGVALQRNTLVTVVFEGGEPALVTSTPQDAELIRAIASEALRLQESPGEIRDQVATLSQIDNPAMAAFLAVHLERIDTTDDPDTSVTLLSQLLDSENVPPEAREDIVDHVVLDYDRLTGGGRATLVSRLAEMGKNSDPRLAGPGIRGLGKIGASDNSMWALIPSDARAGIAQSYRALVGRSAMRRDSALESALGVQ
ncbi:MAG TPA: hypothetical protein VIY49_31880 [Bryobacteraceae bacterium]